MTSDRFGEIRIKPDTAKEPLAHCDNEIEKKIKEPAATGGRPEGADISRAVSRNGTGRHFPFKSGRILPWIAAPLFLVLLYGVGSYFLIPSLVKGPLSKNFSESLGRPVTVGRVVFSPFTLRVLIQDVSVGTVYGDPDGQDLLACAEFTCRIDFLELFHRHLVCHEVRINDIALNLVRLRLGTFSVADAANFFSLIKERKGLIQWPEWLVLDGVRLTDGKIVVNDSLTRKQHRVEQIRFCLPSAQESLTGDDASPRLTAVINASPVQIDGRRQKNMQGGIETIFTLRFSDIVLKNYLDYLPAIQDNPFHLAEGQADIHIELVIPELSNEENRVNVQLEAQIRALQFAGKNGRPILKVPATLLRIQAVPARNRYIVQQADLAEPEFTVSLNTKPEQNRQGTTFAEVKNFLAGVEQYAHGISIEKFSCSEGKLYVFEDGQKTPRYMWSIDTLHLSGLQNQAARQNGQAAAAPAVFQISARETKGDENARLQIKGTVHTPLQFAGTLSVRDLDLKRYPVRLPGGVLFDGGQADMNSSFMYAFGSEDGGKSGVDLAKLDNGDVSIKEFSLLRNGKTVLSGTGMACGKMQVDFAAQDIECESISLNRSRIDGGQLSPAYLAGTHPEEGQWSIRGQSLAVNDSTLLIRSANPFTEKKRSTFTLQKFSLQAENLQSSDPQGNNLKVSAVIGEKGNIELQGEYSAVSDNGRLLVKLNDVELQAVNEYISPWFKPELNGGTIDAEGMYRIEDQTFTGRVSVKNMLSGMEGGPSLQWQEASAEKLFLRMSPFSLELPELLITGPAASCGISHADKPASLFLQPVEAFKGKDRVTIHKIRFTAGTFRMPEPVITQGYQPELSGMTGTISPLGSEAMNFSVRGTLGPQGSFSVQGTTGMESIVDYDLEVSGVPLAPFNSYFSGKVGLDVEDAAGSWQQVVRKAKGEYRVANHIQLDGVVPESGSAYFKTIALYTDQNNSIQLTDEVAYQQGAEPQFLFDLLVRRMMQDAVRSDLSEQLVLKKLLPDMNLQGLVHFVPGTSTLVVTKDLADYELLLSRRPYLRLLLVGQYDPQQDAEALKDVLQQEEDARRDAENKKRAEERRELREREEKRLAELKNDTKQQVVEEKIDPEEFADALQPLPHQEVRIPPSMLVELARKRTAVLYDFLVNGLLLPPERVLLSSDAGKAGPEVQVRIQPYIHAPAAKKETEKNDTAVN